MRAALVAILVFCGGAAAASAAEEIVPPRGAAKTIDDVRERQALDLRTGFWPLAGDDPALASTSDLEPFRDLVGDAPIVALGESYHTTGGFYRLKHRLFRYLVQEMGFRAFAIESLWQGAELTAAYVATCQGSPEQAIRDHINVWQGTEYADLVQWMCEWNRAHPDPADQVTFFGFDIQQPWYDGPALISFLGRIGILPANPWYDGIRSCEAVVDRHPFGQIPQARHDACIQALNGIEAHLNANRADIVRRTSEDDVAVAMLRTVGLRAWENSVFLIAHDYHAGYNARDEGMAYAFHVMHARKAPGAKTVVWAANSHIARSPLPRGEVPFGSYLADTFGDDYRAFALTAYDTEIDFPGFGCGLVDRTAGSVEDRLGVTGEDALLVDTRSPFFRKGPYAMGIDEVRPYRDYHGIFYLEHSPRFHPLVWEPCR